MDTTTALNAILAHSRHLGARWAHEQAVEAARTAILAEVAAVEAALPAPVPTLPTQPGEHWEAGLARRNSAEHARTAPVRALRDAASEVERQCHPGHYTSAETLAAAGLPAEVVARVVADAAAAPNYAAQPVWADAPEVPADVLAALVPEDHDPRGVGPIRPAPGWTLHHLSRWPAAAGYTIQVNYEGTPVARWAPDGGDLRIMAWDEEVAREAAAKAKRKANHDAYQAQLGRVRAALATDPDIRATAWIAAIAGAVVAVGGRADLARACLALAGWHHRDGQEGGTLTPPWGGVAVGAKGAITAWTAHPGVDEPHPGVEAVQSTLGGLGDAGYKGDADLVAWGDGYRAHYHSREECVGAAPSRPHPSGWCVAGSQGYEDGALAGLTLAQAVRLIRRLS